MYVMLFIVSAFFLCPYCSVLLNTLLADSKSLKAFREHSQSNKSHEINPRHQQVRDNDLKLHFIPGSFFEGGLSE